MYFTGCSVEEGSSESDTEAAEETSGDRKVERNVSETIEAVKINSAIENSPVNLIIEEIKQDEAYTESDRNNKTPEYDESKSEFTNSETDVKSLIKDKGDQEICAPAAEQSDVEFVNVCTDPFNEHPEKGRSLFNTEDITKDEEAETVDQKIGQDVLPGM